MTKEVHRSPFIDSRKDRIFLTFLTAAAYFASYMTRVNYKTVLTAIMDAEGYAKDSVSLALTGLFITYGVGQLISGWLGDRINPRYLMCGGLLLASAMNVCLPFCASSIAAMTAVWCVNGFGQAMMWPPIVKTLTNFLSPDDYLHASVKVSWGSSFATVLLYLVCPVIVTVFDWKTVFFLCAGVGVLGAVFLFVSLGRLEKKYPEAGKTAAVPEKMGDAPEQTAAAPKMPRGIYGFFVILLSAIVLQGALRDGVDSWMPSYVQDTFSLGTGISILSGIILPVFTILSYQAATFVYEKILKNEMTCSAVFFGLSAVCSGLLLLLRNVSGAVSGFSVTAAASILLFALIVGSMHAINLCFTCFVPRQFRKFGNISWISGLTNFATYVGSALSTYGFALMTEKSGWNGTILLWIVIAAAGVGVCLAGFGPWKRFLSGLKQKKN